MRYFVKRLNGPVGDVDGSKSQEWKQTIRKQVGRVDNSGRRGGERNAGERGWMEWMDGMLTRDSDRCDGAVTVP